MLSRRFPEEIVLIEQAAVATQEMLGEILSRDSIHPDVTTEQDIREALERKTTARQMTVAFMTIRLAARRLDDPATDRTVRPGDLVSIDFGVVHQGYCSDIQRTAYVLRDGEGAAPADIQRMWDVTAAAHEAAFQSLRPGSTGLAVDSSARRVIEAAGFNGYPHAAGHSLGRQVHDVGPMLGPDWPERYGTLVHAQIQTGQVFAVEPLVYAHVDSQGGEVRIGLEDDVVVEEFGARPFGTPQRRLVLLS
jgi:Xaa-Pro dipeptidase